MQVSNHHLPAHCQHKLIIYLCQQIMTLENTPNHVKNRCVCLSIIPDGMLSPGTVKYAKSKCYVCDTTPRENCLSQGFCCVIIYHHQGQLREGWVYLVCSFRGIRVQHGSKHQIWPQKQLSAHISYCKQETERAKSKWHLFKFSKSTFMAYFLHQGHTSMPAQKGLPTGNKVSKCPKMQVTSHSR